MKNWIFIVISSALAVSGPIAAEERQPKTAETECRSLSLAKRGKIKEKWMQMNQENPVDLSKLDVNNFKINQAVSSDLKVYALYSEASHWVGNVGILGDWVSFEDGSKWQISFSDQFEVSYWWKGDIVYVTQSDKLLSIYDYMIINESRGTVIYANRVSKPYYNGAYTRYIVAIDRFSDRILLNDGTWWNVAWIDDTIMQRWMENDTVIIGINSGWDCLTYPFIVINVGIDAYDLGLDEWVAAQLSY
jgi:hypothetical protein